MVENLERFYRPITNLCFLRRGWEQSPFEYAQKKLIKVVRGPRLSQSWSCHGKSWKMSESDLENSELI